MPIFEYKCGKCGVVFEALLPKADHRVSCAECGSKRVEKQFSTFSARVTAGSAVPCSTGGCPTSGMAGTGCSGGGCPYS